MAFIEAKVEVTTGKVTEQLINTDEISKVYNASVYGREYYIKLKDGNTLSLHQSCYEEIKAKL